MDGAGGNTKPPRISASIHWVLTLNNYTEDELEVLKNTWLDGSLVSQYCVQKEIGESGTPHLQGYIAFTKKARPSELFACKRIHWEKCRSPKDAIAYCSKNDTFAGERWTNIKLPKPIKLLKEEDFYEWQKDIINVIDEEPDDRTIYWYWEGKGGVGKTQFCKYLCMKRGACIMSGKASDCKYGIVKFHEETGNYPELVIFDVPRCNLDFISYDAIESIKNGLFFSGKYEGCQVVFNSPHVIVFANEAPDLYKLSLDRWKVSGIV